MERDLNPAVAAAVELLVAHGWRWVGRGLQPGAEGRRQPEKALLSMHLLHNLLREEAHLL
jgi:hypothetical protein